MSAEAQFNSRRAGPTRAQTARATKRLAPVFHPRWSSRDDHAVMTARAKHKSFSDIAGDLGRSQIAVEQRWHRLRVIKGVVRLLEDYGLSGKPYPADGGGHG